MSGDEVVLRPKRPSLDDQAADVFDRTYTDLVGRYGQDGAEKSAYAATVRFYRKQGAGERTAAQRAGEIKKESPRRRAQGIVPVLISILILFAAYLISNWSIYEKAISAFLIVR